MNETDFAYSARRSQEEIVSAIRAPSSTAACAYWRLSLLHVAQALKALEPRA